MLIIYFEANDAIVNINDQRSVYKSKGISTKIYINQLKHVINKIFSVSTI